MRNTVMLAVTGLGLALIVALATRGWKGWGR